MIDSPMPMLCSDETKPDESFNDDVFSNNIVPTNDTNKPVRNFKPKKSTTELLPISQEMQIYLFGALSSRYLREVMRDFFMSADECNSKT
jgi:hypothetical protein